MVCPTTVNTWYVAKHVAKKVHHYKDDSSSANEFIVEKKKTSYNCTTDLRMSTKWGS